MGGPEDRIKLLRQYITQLKDLLQPPVQPQPAAQPQNGQQPSASQPPATSTTPVAPNAATLNLS